MQKLYKRFIKRINRLIENVRKGSIVDIALLITGVALVITIVVIFLVMLLSNNEESQQQVNSESGSGAQYNSTDRNNDISESQGTVNPFEQNSQSTTTSSSSQSAGQSSSSSSTTSTASSSSTTTTPAATTTTPATTTTTPTTTPQPEQPHEHTYPEEWTRIAHQCEPGLEERRCTTCTEGTEGHIETRQVLAIAEHTWGSQVLIYEEGNDTAVGFSQTCSVCEAVWTEYYEVESSTP